MRAVDTSVLARWVLGDDAAQTQAAHRIVSEPMWISQTVLLELGWVLFKSVALPRETVGLLLQQIVDLETAHVENADALIWAIERFRAGADWADMVHLAACPEDVRIFATFDRALARKAGKNAPVEVETVRA